MPRTPLLNNLRRLLRRDIRPESPPCSTADRRRFFKTLAAASAGAAIAPASLAINTALADDHDDPRVVVVGAGLAGLVCAYRLQQRGVATRIIDAGRRVGGRLLTLRNAFPDRQTVELGGEFIDSDHKAILTLARELGLSVVDLLGSDDSDSWTFFFHDRVQRDETLLAAFRPVAAAIAADVGRMKPRGTLDMKAPHSVELDKLSIAQWLDSRQVAGLIREVIDVAYVGEYGREIAEQSALNLLLMIGDAPQGDDFEPFGQSDERYRIADGNDGMTAGLAQRLTRPVELETRLEAVRAADDGFVLSVRRDARSFEIHAAAVVLATPWTTLRNGRVDLTRLELPRPKRAAIERLGYGAGGKLVAGFSRRVWQQTPGHAANILTDLGFQCCWEASRRQPGTHGILTNFLGGKPGETLASDAMADRSRQFVEQIDRVLPGVQSVYTGQAQRTDWLTAPLTLGSYTCCLPGQYASMLDSAAEPVGNLFFAGEHTNLEFNGFMEGAVQSGQRAAAQVLETVTRPKPSR